VEVGAYVDTLVQVVQGGNGSDNVVVVLVDVELDLATGVGVAKTQLGTLDITIFKTLEELCSVQTDASEQVGTHGGRVTRLAVDTREGSLDRGS
jgi:hypothetical protein